MPDWRLKLGQLSESTTDELHVAFDLKERFHRFREVTGVPAIEAAAVQLNARLAARGAQLAVLTHEVVCKLAGQQRTESVIGEFVPSQWQLYNSTGGLGSLRFSRWTLALALLRMLASLHLARIVKEV